MLDFRITGFWILTYSSAKSPQKKPTLCAAVTRHVLDWLCRQQLALQNSARAGYRSYSVLAACFVWMSLECLPKGSCSGNMVFSVVLWGRMSPTKGRADLTLRKLDPVVLRVLTSPRGPLSVHLARGATSHVVA